MTIKGLAPAKINLTLHITGQRDDGYHLLDSVVVFADFGDELTLTPAESMSLHVTGPFAEGVPTDARNLVWRAAEAAGWTGRIDLIKNLPHAAGIGGGSSDAATVLRVLAQNGFPTDQATALSLGADVPVCLDARAARMRGTGETIDPIRLPPLPALLVNPGVHVPTSQVFSVLPSRTNPPMPEVIPNFTSPADCAAWLAEQRNDMERPAIGCAEPIDAALEALRDTKDVLFTRMSGSGATCFGLYPTMKAAHFAAYEIGTSQSDWWCVATELS